MKIDLLIQKPYHHKLYFFHQIPENLKKISKIIRISFDLGLHPWNQPTKTNVQFPECIRAGEYLWYPGNPLTLTQIWTSFYIFLSVKVAKFAIIELFRLVFNFLGIPQKGIKANGVALKLKPSISSYSKTRTTPPNSEIICG